MASAEAHSIGDDTVLLDHRMADKAGRQSYLLKIRKLERQDTEEMIEEARDHLGATRPPSPDGRRDVVDEQRTAPLELPLHTKGEGRRVDGDHRIRPHLLRSRDGLADAPQHARDMRHDLDDAHDVELAEGNQAREALARHRRTSDAGEAYATSGLLFQRPHEPGAKSVGRGFGGDQEDQGTFCHLRSKP